MAYDTDKPADAGKGETTVPVLYRPGDDFPVTFSYRERTWRTLQPILIDVNGVLVRIPGPGWKSDLASVPRFLRGIVNTYELGGLMPPILHDFAYHNRGHLETAATPPTRYTRRAADRIFREAMKAEGVGLMKRLLGWSAVRVFGWFPWPPSRSFLRQGIVKALNTAWQATGGVLLVDWWSTLPAVAWLVVPIASGLSLLKSLAGVPMAERVAGVVYR